MLPEGLVGKGLGSRAFLHALKSGLVMHDSSYSCPIELRGSKQVLQHLLKQVRCHTSFIAYLQASLLNHNRMNLSCSMSLTPSGSWQAGSVFNMS